ncbi:hypothetical protein B0T22DRAFT_567 [Podospora appendiculata]|uniref:Uncharacterized protein n=1 Tax=Podospora appendiculata TaxID=314037 RepID=A0AAE0XEM5_9PEZI|nr:hypothetical protein B0T22DRAFT_567 [Podospora appendiculata]
MSGAGDGGGPDSRARDFATDPIATSTQPELPSTAATSSPLRVHCASGPLHIDTSIPAVTSLASPRDQNSHAPTRSDTELTHSVAFTPSIRRRQGRSGTFRTVEDFDAFETVRPGWHRMSPSSLPLLSQAIGC